LCFWLPISWAILHNFSHFLELPMPLKNTDFLHTYSPWVHVNRANISLALLPVFTQNLMFMRCSKFLSLIFLPTIYHRHVLLPLLLRTNNSFGFNSCKHKLGHVCLTQHLSD
jgi:hypothetical protein